MILVIDHDPLFSHTQIRRLSITAKKPVLLCHFNDETHLSQKQGRLRNRHLREAGNLNKGAYSSADLWDAC